MDRIAGDAEAGRFTNPIAGVALGDPFVLRHRGRFYLYGTNDGPPLIDGRAIPVYRSDDLIRWEPLGGALVPTDPTADHWAPEVLAWNGHFYMVVSFGDVDRTGHALWVAIADRPEGPFHLARRVSGPDEQFSIDGSWLLDDDGRLYLFRCLDFVDDPDPPHGTGIVVQEMADPLTPIGRPSTVLRAHAPWHLFEADRTMRLYEGRRFPAWTTIEGPSPVRRDGKVYCGYSGGNYTGAYGTGEAVADAPLGPYRDARGAVGPIFGTTAGLVEGPGHFSVVRPDGLNDWIILHGRTPGEPVRRVWLCPAEWGPDGVTIGALTDRPQSAPPLPRVRERFEGPEGAEPVEWSIESGVWRFDGDGLRHTDPESTGILRGGPELVGDFVVEVYVRLPEPSSRSAGFVIGTLVVEVGREAVRVQIAEGLASTAPLPTLGDEAFNPSVYHAVELRVMGDFGELRVDGVLIFDAIPDLFGSHHLALRADGVAAFAALSVTDVR